MRAKRVVTVPGNCALGSTEKGLFGRVFCRKVSAKWQIKYDNPAFLKTLYDTLCCNPARLVERGFRASGPK